MKEKINLGLRGYEELFMSQQERDDQKREKVMDIPLNELYPFKDHPFYVKVNDELNEMARSICEHGVLTPALVRPRKEGGYELISGHRRKAASELAGMETLPVIVRELDDDAAIIAMVDSNQQRENLLPSEKAFAYDMKLRAMKHQGKASGQLGQKWSREQLSKDESGRTIQRYIRLTKLIPEFLKMVDEERIAMTPAVEISYLSKQIQKELLSVCEMQDCTPSLSQAVRLKKLSQEGMLEAHNVVQIMSEPKANQRDKLTFRKDTFEKYFPKGYTTEQMEQSIISMLKERKRKLDRDAR